MEMVLKLQYKSRALLAYRGIARLGQWVRVTAAELHLRKTIWNYYSILQ